jgi:acyl-CoA thioester hydrolase
VAAAFEYEFEVGPESVDANGHVNNVEFVRWMQEAAVRHSDQVGCTAATRQAGATWVVRAHRIEYKRPAYAGERVHVATWVADFRRAFSLRRYRFTRAADGTVLAEGETDWAFVDINTGRPRSIVSDVAAMFELVPDPPKP